MKTKLRNPWEYSNIKIDQYSPVDLEAIKALMNQGFSEEQARQVVKALDRMVSEAVRDYRKETTK